MKKNPCIIVCLVLMSLGTAWAQKKSAGIDRIVFGSYAVGQLDLKEYVISKSGDILFTARMDKQYSHVGHIDKTQNKELFLYCDTNEWNDFIKFNPGKDYQYVRLYTGKEYVEMMWSKESGDAQMNEIYTKLSHHVLGFALPAPVMASKQ
jgi:hypothetical protein